MNFSAGKAGSVTFTTEGTDGKYVIIDAVQFIPVDDQTKQTEVERERLAGRISALEKDIKKQKSSGPKRETAMVTGDDDDAGDIPLAIRGVVHNPGEIVKRGFLQVAAKHARPEIPEGESGRRELAEWIADPENPLTSRVIVNRVWYWLMGRGIVESVDNFGSMGNRPTHPELLDHLATRFVQQGWSMKTLVRDIMLSRVYRQSSQANHDSAKVDPANRLLWRMNRKRLRAEDIRDSLLFVGGTLDLKAGGPNFKPGTRSEYGYTFTRYAAKRLRSGLSQYAATNF